MAGPLPYTAELVAKLDAALAEIVIAGKDCDPLAILTANGIGLIDRSRAQALIDERVYTGALRRSQAWEDLARRGRPVAQPIVPSPTTWRNLKP